MNSYSDKLRRERREELALRALSSIEEVDAPDLYTYEIEVEDTEFGFLPPFMKANMIKGLEKKLAAESDDDKKAEIQAKINKLKGDKKEEMASRVAYILDDDQEVELGIVKSVSNFFNEKLHPRGKDGKFAESDGGANAKSQGPDDADLQKLANSSEIKKIDVDIKKTLAEANRLEEDAGALTSQIIKELRSHPSLINAYYNLSDSDKKLADEHDRQSEDAKELLVKAAAFRSKALALNEKKYTAAYKLLKAGDDVFKKKRARKLLGDVGNMKPVPKPVPKSVPKPIPSAPIPVRKPIPSGQRVPNII